MSKRQQQIKRKRKAFTSYLAMFENAASLTATKAAKETAKELTEEAREIIETQRYNWTPLNDDYRQKKIDEGHDGRTLIRTGEYLAAISWGVTHNKVWAGIPSRKMHTGSDLPVYVLAKIHEFGTSRIPARPLWRPLLAKYAKRRTKFGPQYRREIVAAMNRARRNASK